MRKSKVFFCFIIAMQIKVLTIPVTNMKLFLIDSRILPISTHESIHINAISKKLKELRMSSLKLNEIILVTFFDSFINPYMRESASSNSLVIYQHKLLR